MLANELIVVLDSFDYVIVHLRIKLERDPLRLWESGSDFRRTMIDLVTSDTRDHELVHSEGWCS